MNIIKIKKVSLIVSSDMQDNNIFSKNQHLHELSEIWSDLKEEYKKYNYDLSTNDINKIEDSEIVIYADDMPKNLPKNHDVSKSYIILYEGAFIRPRNFDKDRHQDFKKIFTWDDRLIDNNKYFKFNYPQNFPNHINKKIKNKKLCVLISSNKIPPHTLKDDLYLKRIEAIRWFEAYHLDEFDLYGMHWDRYKFSGFISRVFNNISFIRDNYIKLTNKKYISYKGVVDNKKEVMEKYKFSICYENVKNASGYISEKIFDSFFAGCVPIYWGADNVSEYIPKECFIDKREFKTYEELYIFMKNMSDDTYEEYLNNIEIFINSEKSLPFKSDSFVKLIISNTLE